jgi:hypothetical protein
MGPPQSAPTTSGGRVAYVDNGAGELRRHVDHATGELHGTNYMARRVRGVLGIGSASFPTRNPVW